MSITNKITKFRCSELAARRYQGEKNIVWVAREAIFGTSHTILGASRC